MRWPGWTSWAAAGPVPARRSAFSIPLVAGLADGHTIACRPRGLVLVPTRELASQVHAVLAPLAAAMDLTRGHHLRRHRAECRR